MDFLLLVYDPSGLRKRISNFFQDLNLHRNIVSIVPPEPLLSMNETSQLFYRLVGDLLQKVPISDGIESNPQDGIILILFLEASSWCFSISSLTQKFSPVISTYCVMLYACCNSFDPYLWKGPVDKITILNNIFQSFSSSESATKISILGEIFLAIFLVCQGFAYDYPWYQDKAIEST